MLKSPTRKKVITCCPFWIFWYHNQDKVKLKSLSIYALMYFTNLHVVEVLPVMSKHPTI